MDPLEVSIDNPRGGMSPLTDELPPFDGSAAFESFIAFGTSVTAPAVTMGVAVVPPARQGVPPAAVSTADSQKRRSSWRPFRRPSNKAMI